MSSCAGCGQTAGPADRFCAQCGLPLGTVEQFGDLPQVEVAPQSPDTGEDTETRIRRNQRWTAGRRTVALALLVVVAALTWTAVRRPTTSVPGLTGELAGPQTTAPSASSAVPERGSTTAPSTEQGEENGGVIVVDPDLLDPSLADYRLLAARNREVVDIDLATGEATTRPTAGRLIGVFDQQLIVVDPATGVAALPIAGTGSESAPIFTVASDGSSVLSAVVDEDAILHITTADVSDETPQSVMTRIDLATGSEVSAEVSAFGSMGLVEVSGAGVFSLDEDGFRRLTDASVELYGSTYLLVDQCDDPLQCRRFWVQRSLGVRFSRPLPAFRSGYALGRNGRVAVGTRVDGRGFFDVRMAREVPIDDAHPGIDGPWFVVEDLTDDERFLAAVVGTAGNDVVIHDLDDQTTVRFELGRSSPLSKVLFLPKAARG